MITGKLTTIDFPTVMVGEASVRLPDPIKVVKGKWRDGCGYEHGSIADLKVGGSVSVLGASLAPGNVVVGEVHSIRVNEEERQ